MGWLSSLVAIILICIVALVWYFVHLMAQGFTSQYKDEQEFISDQLRSLLGTDEIQASSYRPTVEPQYLSGIVDLIETSIGGMWLAQCLYFLLLLFLFFLVVDIWFIEYPFAFIFNALIGGVAVLLFAFYVSTTNSKALTRALIASQYSKEECFGYMYQCGFAIMSLIVGLIFGLYVLMYYFNVSIWGEDNQKVSILMIGYLMGMIFGGFIFREGISMFCRSLKTSTFGLIRADLNLSVGNNNISQLTRLAYMISQQAGNSLINYIDSALILIFICCSTGQLALSSPEIMKSDNKSSFILGPIFLVCILYLGGIICYFLKTMFADQETGSFAALNVRWQVLIGALLSLIILLTFPLTFLVDNFTLKGEKTDSINQIGKVQMHGCWCYVLGLIFNVIHISMFEWYTSHGCPNVRNMGLATSDRILPMNFIYSNYLGELFSALPLILMIFLALIVFNIYGFAGLLFSAFGYISLFIIYGIIFFIGSNSSDSYKLTCFAHFIPDVQGKIFQIYWETKNYMIYLKSTHSGTLFLACLGLIGSQLYQYPIALDNLFTKEKGFIGLLVGFSTIYVCKGINTWGIINIAKKYFIFQPSDDSEGKLNYLNDIRIIEFSKFKYTHSMLYVAYNLLFVTIIDLVFASIFGQAVSVSIMIGSTIGALMIQYSSLIKGTTLENSRIYNEIQDNRKDRHYLMYVSGDTYACATEESNACPLVVYLIYSVSLLTACQKHFSS